MTLTVTPTIDPADSPPRIRLDLTTTGTANALFTLVRNDPDGRARPVVLEQNPHFTSGAVTLWDYHAPFNQAVSYTASSETQVYTTAQITLAVSSAWLIHRVNPGLSRQIDKILSIGDRVTPTTSTLHWAYGAEFPVSRSEGTRRARSGTLTFQAASEADLSDIHDLLADSGACLLNVGLDGWPDERWAWIQPGDLTDTNPAGGWVYYPTRNYSFPYQVVDTPAAVLAPAWAYSDVLSTYGSYSAIPGTYASYSNLTIDYRAY